MALRPHLAHATLPLLKIPFIDFSLTNYDDAVALTTIITIVIIHFIEGGYLSQENFFFQVMSDSTHLFISQTITKAAFIYCHL